MAGIIEVLSGRGHDEIKLDGTGAENKAKVDDLLAKRYTIMVPVGEGDQKVEKKVTSFDAEANEFVIEEVTTKTVEEKNTIRVAAANAVATAIAPQAGG